MATVDRPAAQAPITADGRSTVTPTPPSVVRPPKPFFIRSWFALVVVVGLIAAHIYGWQASEIDPGKLVGAIPNIGRFVGQVLSPDIIGHDQARIEQQIPILGAATPTDVQPAQGGDIQVPNIFSGETVKDVPPDIQTYNVAVNVSAGTVAPGQQITVSGSSFRPNTAGEVLWRSTGQSASVQRLGTFTSDGQGNFSVKVAVPTDVDRVINASGFANTLAVRQTWDYGDPYLSDAMKLCWDRILETIFLALMATTFSIVISVPLSFLASHNLMSHNLVSNTIYYITRTFLNILRSMEVIIWAIIFAATVGLGPFAGMLALAIHSIASLGKLYSEAIESIDPGPLEALTATGANRLQVIMYAVVPQFIPQFLSFTMYRWDINVRMSTIVGFVGGGGIGFILQQYINLLQWNQAGTALWMIAIVVILMDWVSSMVRKAVI